MTTESIVLVGRERSGTAELFETHAHRLAERTAVDTVETATYETEPVQELRGQFRELSADRVYAVPMRVAHNHDTTRGVPAALSHVPDEVVYCEPPGGSEAVTDVIEQKATGLASARAETTLVLVGRALEDAGLTVQPAKAGPDFIDPSHHEAVFGRPSRTLDCWLEGTEGLRRNYARGDGDICLVEGVMGLYDGDGSSSAMVAETLDLPVMLVVDASAGMESVAATALGFQQYAAEVGLDNMIE